MLGVHLFLDSLFGHYQPFLLVPSATMLITSITISAWFGGLGPGIVATALSALMADYHFAYPLHSFAGLSLESTPLVAYGLEGVFVSTLVVTLRYAWGRAEESAREARSNKVRYQAVVEQAAEGILLVDVSTKRVLDSNAAHQGLLGYSSEDMVYLTLYDLVPYSKEDTDGYFRRILDQSRSVGGEWKYRRKDGSLIDVQVSANVILDGGSEVVCMVVRDITERKRAEEDLHFLHHELAERERELQELARRTVAVQEEERRRVAYEVHDGFTQTAAAAYRRLQTFAEHRNPKSKDDRKALEDAIQLVGRTVEEARSIIENLRPTTLDDFGLSTAIRMQLEELENEGFETSYEGALGEERLPPTLEINLFRVTQEALSNARKHARTDSVRVEIGRRDGIVRLEVRDWGQGFHATAERGKTGPGETVGFSSMRDRVALLHGSLDIRSEPGMGTSVVTEIPLPVALEEKEADDEDRT